MSVPQNYPLALPYVRLSINGTVRTSELESGTLEVKQILGSQVDTCKFVIKLAESWRATAGSVPTVGQSVLIEVATGSGAYSKLFGGYLTRVLADKISTGRRRFNCEGTDYTQLMNRVLVNQTYVGSTISDIVSQVVQTYVPFVSTSGVQSMPVVVYPSVTFAKVYPSVVVEQLAQMVGWQWYITPDQVLQFYDPAQQPLSAMQVTDGSSNFDLLTIEPQIDQVRNRVFVQGGAALSPPTQEIIDTNGARTIWQLGHDNISGNLSVTASGLLTSFMTVNGTPQIVGLEGIADESAVGALNGFMLDATNGIVRNAGATQVIPDNSRIIFTYQYSVPVAVVREDLASQTTIAQLEGTDYATVIATDAPRYWFPLTETAGTTATDNATNATSFSGMYIGAYELGDEGPLTGNQGTAVRFAGGGRIQMYSGCQLPTSAYTLEGWVQADPTQKNAGLFGQWTSAINSGAQPGIGAVVTVSGGQYHLKHLNFSFASHYAPTGTGFDHVVATWNGSVFRMYVNKQVAIIAPTGGSPLDLPAVSGIEIGNFGYAASPHQAAAIMSQVAIYDYALGTDRIAAHYDAGRYGGVREFLLVDNAIGSFDQARKQGDGELQRWGNLVTDITFQSFVPGWTVGQRVPVAVTMSGIGVTFSGAALIQDIDFVWLGAQRVRYDVHCVSTRFNVVDYYQALTRSRDLVQGTPSPIDLVRALPGTLIIAGGSTTATLNIPPFLVAPDWGSGTTPFIACEFWIIDPNLY